MFINRRAFLYFQNANVVHMCDLVINRCYPYMDHPEGRTVAGSIDYLEGYSKVSE